MRTNQIVTQGAQPSDAGVVLLEKFELTGLEVELFGPFDVLFGGDQDVSDEGFDDRRQRFLPLPEVIEALAQAEQVFGQIIECGFVFHEGFPVMSSDLKTCHERAFSVASAMPEHFLREASCLIGLLLETGASFHASKTALQPLFSRLPEGLKERA